MIIYSASKAEFQDDVLDNALVDKILAGMKEKLNRGVSLSEVNSWRSSLLYMDKVVSGGDIPEDAGISIEYTIPQTGNRIDFIITGKDSNDGNVAILIELKQWSEANLTDRDAVVTTFVGKAVRDMNHPSYQVWSYAQLMRDFNQSIGENKIQLKPCAYLHNYVEDDIIGNEFYKEYIDQAPVFYKGQARKLRDFIHEGVQTGDVDDILTQIDQSIIRPSKNLADRLSSMIAGNAEFVMIDEQKIAYENVLRAANRGDQEKQVIVINGGPGTGKSVVAVKLLVELLGRGLNARYVTKNSAPRKVYEAKLTGSMKKSSITNLFTGSGGFTSTGEDDFDVLLVDEAHRLNAKSGMYSNLGENQIMEIVKSSKVAVFFLDENQAVTWKDIGTRNEISKWAGQAGVAVQDVELQSQFRCNGSDGYLSWIDNTLQIKETANKNLSDIDYDFRVLNDPNEMRDLIYVANEPRNKARIVAGYCWDWVTKNDPEAEGDITIPEYNFTMTWNLASDGGLWMIKPDSVAEAGCIHTCQGLEMDYVGVIIGPDLIVRNGKVITDASKRSKNDSSIKGYKKVYRTDPEGADARADSIIKNTYRTLMTRATKGCYIYCTDRETSEYFKEYK